jgi:holo-[acyl-carrier protein] synthase
MIIGIGVDLIDVRRFESIIFRWQHKFLKRIFTDKEIKYCNTKKHPAQRFATRYAAKEAFVKALFPRGQKGVSLKDIEKELAKERDIKDVHLMVSHDGDYGIANVVLEG